MKYFKFYIFILLLFNSNSYSQRIGLLKIGDDYLPNNKYDITSNGKYTLSNSDLSVGIMIPINTKYFNTNYKIEISIHKIIEKGFRYESRYHNYDLLFTNHISGLNEILIGKRFLLSNNNSIIPQIGFGFQIESLYRDSPHKSYESLTYNTVLFDLAVSYLYSIDKMHIGCMLNWAQGIKKSSFVYEATDRVGLSLLLGL